MGRRTPKSETKLVAAVLFYGACGCSARKRGGGVGKRIELAARLVHPSSLSRAPHVRRLFSEERLSTDIRPIDPSLGERRKERLDQRISREIRTKREARRSSSRRSDPAAAWSRVFERTRVATRGVASFYRPCDPRPLWAPNFSSALGSRACSPTDRNGGEVRKRGNAKRSYISVTLP